MSADAENSAKPPEEGSVGQNALGLGERLRSARKAKALTIEQVAEAMHLDESIITLLEDEKFESFGAAVYVRGHLKAYAQILGLPEKSVLEAYHGENPKEITAPALRRRTGTAIAVNPMMWGIGTLAVALGLVLAIYVFQDDEIESDLLTVQTDADTADDSTSPAGRAQERDDLADIEVVDDDRIGGSARTRQTATFSDVTKMPSSDQVPVNTQQRSSDAADDSALTVRREAQIDVDITTTEPEREAASVSPRPAATMRLTLRFSEESWVEISDARRRLLFGLQRQGRRREITGEPPFNLLIGNANGVELAINDQPFDLPVSGRRGKVARFEITGDTLN